MALPNKGTLHDGFATDTTAGNLISQKIMGVVQLLADILGVDYSAGTVTVSEALASFNTTSGQFEQLAAVGEDSENGLVINDSTNGIKIRIRADGLAGASSFVIELWDDGDEEYGAIFLMTPIGLASAAGAPSAITSIANGTGVDGSLTGNVGTFALADGGVDTAQLADGAVTNAKVASVSGTKLAATTLTPARFNGAGYSELPLVISASAGAWQQIVSAGIDDDAVDSDQLADDAVIEEHLAASSVTAAKIDASLVAQGKMILQTPFGPSWQTVDASEILPDGDFVMVHNQVSGGWNYDAWEDVNYAAIKYDTGSFWRSGYPSRFTIQSGNDGIYHIYANMFGFQLADSAGPSDFIGLRIVKHTSSGDTTVATKYWNTKATAYEGIAIDSLWVQIEGTADLNVNDYITIQTYNSGGLEVQMDGDGIVFMHKCVNG